MSLKPPPIQDIIAGVNGRSPQTWVLWFNSIARILGGSEPMQLPSYTVSSLPAATSFVARIVYVSDESGGATIAFSDGTNWRRVQDRVIVS